MDGAVERDLARARDELAKLGRTLPGDDATEIARYVAERKRNWPRRRSRAAVPTGAVRTGDADAVSQLVSGYDEMDDSGSGSEGEIRENAENVSSVPAGAPAQNNNENRNNNNIPPTPLPINKKTFNNRDRRARKRNTLLGAMLQKSIEKERFVLLEAFKHLISSRQ